MKIEIIFLIGLIWLIFFFFLIFSPLYDATIDYYKKPCAKPYYYQSFYGLNEQCVYYETKHIQIEHQRYKP